ncbi:MAG TPA: ABC transporter ATP-binding protein [bacterium]|nr:ABC transporter ATP-binding protein [bacterium]HPN33108.1 ABC transporter ATP-binding protein [bacterium]
MLQLQKISKIYWKQGHCIIALPPADLTVGEGEFIAVRGASGSGKTTLLLIAGGLLHPDSGHVLVQGKDLYQMERGDRAHWRSRNIGFVFQQYHLMPYLSVLDNVLVPQLAAEIGGLEERAVELIHHFGLASRQFHLPFELSAGEKQRVALARALLLKPRIILADEITGNLDPHNAGIVLRFLHEFVDQGGSVVLATHDAGAAAQAHRTLSLSIEKNMIGTE